MEKKELCLFCGKELTDSWEIKQGIHDKCWNNFVGEFWNEKTGMKIFKKED